MSGGSAANASAERVRKATKIVQRIEPNLTIDGELQFDAALVRAMGNVKAPDSVVAGGANVFIFPGLDAGNIGYKIAERLRGLVAVGPILQGLSRPLNDLSRGCNWYDVFMMALRSAVQSGGRRALVTSEVAVPEPSGSLVR